jgi:hypothetical protein
MTGPKYATERRAQGLCEGCGKLSPTCDGLHTLGRGEDGLEKPLWHPGCAIREVERLQSQLQVAVEALRGIGRRTIDGDARERAEAALRAIDGAGEGSEEG